MVGNLRLSTRRRSSRSSRALPDDSRSTCNDSSPCGTTVVSTRPLSLTSSSTKPSSPSVRELMGCTLDVAAMTTWDRSGTMA